MKIPMMEREKILTRLITAKEYNSNLELLEDYKKELKILNDAYSMTPSTLSKDLHRFGFIKDKNGRWKVSEVHKQIENKKAFIPIWNSDVLEIGDDFHLIYIKTKIGSSEFIARMIKELLGDQIIGYICGAEVIILLSADKAVTMQELVEVSNITLIDRGGYDLPLEKGKLL